LGTLNGSQAVQFVTAGLKSLYLSGWQVAADANIDGETFPDQSLYSVASVPALVSRLNNALLRQDQIAALSGKRGERDWLVPIVADGEAGGGIPLVYQLMRSMIKAGAAGVHFEDQLAAEKKCGHMGGKVLVPTRQHIRTLQAARLAADVMNVPTILIARTDSLDAKLITSDIDERDREFIVAGERTPEGFHRWTGGLKSVIARGLAYAPYADLLWFETGKPDLEEARQFAEAIHAQFPGKKLSYNCSPSFPWKKHLTPEVIARFNDELGAMGYAYQFVTLAGWHDINLGAFTLGRGFAEKGMAAYVPLQNREFDAEADGYEAVRHQRQAGGGVFDEVVNVVSGGTAETTALKNSTEEHF